MTNQILFTLTKTLMFKNRTHKLEMPLGTTYYTVHITSISFLHAKDLLALICSSPSRNVKLKILESPCIFYSTIPLSKTTYPLCKRFWSKIYLSSNTLRLAQWLPCLTLHRSCIQLFSSLKDGIFCNSINVGLGKILFIKSLFHHPSRIQYRFLVYVQCL